MKEYVRPSVSGIEIHNLLFVSSGNRQNSKECVREIPPVPSKIPASEIHNLCYKQKTSPEMYSSNVGLTLLPSLLGPILNQFLS